MYELPKSQSSFFLHLHSHGTFHSQMSILSSQEAERTKQECTQHPCPVPLCSTCPQLNKQTKHPQSPKSLPVTGFLSNLRGAAPFSANHCSFLMPVPQARAKGGRFLRRQAMAFFLWPQAQSSMGEFGFFFSLFFIFIPKFQQHQLPFIQC